MYHAQSVDNPTLTTRWIVVIRSIDVTGYRDRTWCMDASCGLWEACDRAYTDEVHTHAVVWWGGPHPRVSVYKDALACYVQGKQGETDE
jgi:hypothetical protein